MKEISKEIGKRLINLRKEINKTQQEVADSIPGLTIQMISSYENGKQSPAIENLIKISSFYNVSIDYLLTGKETSKSVSKITNYEELIRTILMIKECGIFTVSTSMGYVGVDYSCEYDYNLFSHNETLYRFNENYEKLLAAKEIMGEEMYKMALDGLISKYKNTPIKEENPTPTLVKF